MQVIEFYLIHNSNDLNNNNLKIKSLIFLHIGCLKNLIQNFNPFQSTFRKYFSKISLQKEKNPIKIIAKFITNITFHKLISDRKSNSA